MNKKNLSLILTTLCLCSFLSTIDSNSSYKLALASSVQEEKVNKELKTVEEIDKNIDTLDCISSKLPVEREGFEPREIKRYYNDDSLVKLEVDMHSDGGKVNGQVEIYYHENYIIGVKDSFYNYEFDQDRLMKVFNKDGSENTSFRGGYLNQKEDYFLNISLTYKSIQENFGYDLEEVNYVNEDITINYPEISNFRGILLQDYMNQDITNLVNKYTTGNYSDVNIDYTLTRRDSDYLSIVFSGTATIDALGREINILESLTFDIGDSCNLITTNDFIKDHAALRERLEEAYGKPLEYEGLRVYFDGNYATFYFMPLDDSACEFVKISLHLGDIEDIVNYDFGEKAAS